jgi:hypothetical protein
MTTELSNENFLLFAAKNYDNPSCLTLKEFHDDLKRIKYIKRLFKRYKKNGIISERLILNHIILMHNVFGDATVQLLFFKIEQEFWPQLKTFLIFLNYLKEHDKIANRIPEEVISLDENIINKLRNI